MVSLDSLVKISESGQALLVSGSINFKNVVKLRNQGYQLLSKQSQARIIIDLQDINEADNSGLVLLLAWMRDAKSLGKTISFNHVPDFIATMAEVFGLQNILFRAT